MTCYDVLCWVQDRDVDAWFEMPGSQTKAGDQDGVLVPLEWRLAGEASTRRQAVGNELENGRRLRRGVVISTPALLLGRVDPLVERANGWQVGVVGRGVENSSILTGRGGEEMGFGAGNRLDARSKPPN